MFEVQKVIKDPEWKDGICVHLSGVRESIHPIMGISPIYPCSFTVDGELWDITENTSKIVDVLRGYAEAFTLAADTAEKDILDYQQKQHVGQTNA